MIAYTGEFEVEDECFYLKADRFIVRDSEIAFMLSGSDQSGDFKIEGVAYQSESGSFVAGDIPLIYPKYAGNCVATLQFDRVNLTKEKLRCHVRGMWQQQGDIWFFSGNLKKYKT